MTTDPRPWPARLAHGWLNANAEWIALFRGRARRSEVWLAILLAAIVGLALSSATSLWPVLIRIENNAVFGRADPVAWWDVWSSFVRNGAHFFGSTCVIALPALVRRCHDRGRSAWWLALALALALVPYLRVAAAIWLLFDLGLAPGTPGANRFNPSPKLAGRTQRPRDAGERPQRV